MVDSATEFRKSGFNEEDSATLAGVAAMFQNVADDAISASDSAGFIIAQLKAFNLEASDAEHVIDAVNNVSNNFAVSSSDLSTNLGKASAALASGNTSFEETLGLMTAITEITRNGSRSARGLVSIQSRLNQVVDESSSTGKQLIELYKEQGIALFDQNGQLRDSYDILKDLAAVWPTLTRNQQAEFALAQAGANQTQNFTALMNNFQVAIDATATAMDSAGSAMKENTSYMESLEAQTTQLKATFQDFANNVIDKELVSTALAGLNNALEALNTPVGKTITQWALLTGVFTGGLTIYGQIASKLIGAAKSGLTFASAITGAGSAASGAAVGFGTLATTALPIAAILAGVAIAGWEVYKWIKDTHKPLQEYTDEIQANTQQLETNRDRLAEIEQMPWDKKTPEILDEYDALVKQNEELQRNIDLLEERRRNQAVRQARSGGQVQQGSTYSFDGLLWSTDSEEEAWNTLASTLGMAGASIDEVKEKAKELGYTLQENAITVKANYLEYDQHLIKSLEAYQQKVKDGKDLTNEEIRDYQNLKNEAAERVEGLKELNAQGETLYYTENKLIDVYDSLALAESVAKNEMVSLNQEGVSALLAKYPQLKSAIEDVNGVSYLNVTALGKVKNATVEDKVAMYDLIAAQTVFNNSSLNVSDKITQLAALAEQAGATAASIATVMGVSSSDFSRTVKGLVQTKQAKNEQEATQILLKRMYSDMLKTIPTGGGTVEGTPIYPSTASSTTKKATTAAKKATDLAFEEFKNLQKDLEHQRELGLINEEEYYDKLEQLIKDYKAKATAHMKEYGTDVDTINRNMYQYEEEIYKGRAKLAENLAEQQKKAAEEAAQAQKEALEKQKEDFESAVNYVIKQIDEEISKLQDLRDQTEQYYDDKIDAVNKANDALEDQIQYEELLNNLAKAKDKQLYVFQNGQFQYVQDVEAIASAQSELDAYERDKALQDEVNNLETLKEQALASIDEQIEGWENYKEEWESVTTQYQEQQDKLLAEQILGIDAEQNNWKTRLANVQSFVDQYNSILNGLNTSGGKTNTSGVPSGGNGYHFDFTKTGGWTQEEMKEGFIPSSETYSRGSLAGAIKKATTTGISGKLSRHKIGTLSAPGGLSLVGERGPELRVLNSGDGIIPADATRNLWDWANYNPKDFMGSMGSDNIFHIGNIALPNVTDAKSFVNGLKQLAYQRAYKRA